MGALSVAQAASRLGVSVSRIHQRIADGSLQAERIGSQWVVDERSLLHVEERRRPGRPLSRGSAWAVIASAEEDPSPQRPAVASFPRARVHLNRILDLARERPSSEAMVAESAVALRAMFRNRAERRLFRAAPSDLGDLRVDGRWAASVDLGACGIAAVDVEGYIEESRVAGLLRDHLLAGADHDANVVLHVIVDSQHPYPGSRLRLAADLAERRGPREEAAAARLLHEIAAEREAAGR